MPWSAALPLVLLAAACAAGEGGPALPRPGADGVTLLVEGLSNGGFELVADSTTSPPKYGAYWVGAFAVAEGDPTDLVAEGDDAAEGRRWLVLEPDAPGVHQKVVTDPRWTERLVLRLRWRGAPGARPAITLEDGPGRRATRPAPGGSGPDERGWREVELALGEEFLAEHGSRAVPRLELHLEALGGRVEIDACSVEIALPLVTEAAAAAVIEDLVTWTLRAWVLSPAEGGLGLVEPDTGYVVAEAFDVETGTGVEPSPVRHIHSLHGLLVSWIAHCERSGRDDEAERWRGPLRRFVTTLLDRHFDPQTGLPRLLHHERGPLPNAPVTVGAFVEFLVEASAVLGDPALETRCREQVRRVGDALVALQRQHDLDPSARPNEVKLDRATGRFLGQHENWFGHLPNRLTPRGEIEPPQQFNTSWAIVTGRSFWYHLLKSPAAIMAAHEVQPREGDVAAVARAVSRFSRPWDAARYDLENDTDDHYGYLAEDLGTILKHGGASVPGAVELLLTATDHRLPRDAADAGDTLWIQAVRLGTSCAGDSPRAFKGVLDLYELPPEASPTTSGLPLYRDALLELAANDWKGRQLTNSQFTESFFRLWEMVCICFKGTYQGDCRERPDGPWDGDVGDIFGGPPLQSVNAQVWAFRVAGPEARREILARLGTLHHVTEAALRRPFGYLAGLDPEVARQYDLPAKYTLGVLRNSPAGLGYVNAWMALLPLLDAGP